MTDESDAATPPLDPAVYDTLRAAVAAGGPIGAATKLVDELRKADDFQNLFYALLLKKRVELGVSPFPTGPAADLPQVEFIERATQPAVVARLDEGGVDVLIVDGEAQPAGGLGVCRQAKDEVYDCPPVLAIIGRRDDGWLATWSRADGAVPHPIDPIRLPAAVAALLRPRASTETAVAPTTPVS